jgi:hypothetical protein
MQKQISIVVAASGEIRDVALSPGATVSDVLAEADLQGYQLTRKDGELLTPDTDLYEVVADSEKLYATPEDISVGVGGSASLTKVWSILRSIGNFIREIISDNHDYYPPPRRPLNSKKAWVIRIRYITHKVIYAGTRKMPGLTGSNTENPYWIEAGWRKYNGAYEGYYFTRHGRWRGLVQESYSDMYIFYIFDPPKALKESSHWPCFILKGPGKYSIHFSKRPEDLSSGIISIEQLISESFKEKRKGQDYEE